MPTGLACPNPICSHVFPPSVIGTASLSCPRCGSVFQFRAGGPPIASAEPPPPILAVPPLPIRANEKPSVPPLLPISASPPFPGRIPIQCSCGQVIQAEIEYAGMDLPCPACGMCVAVPRSATTLPVPAAALLNCGTAAPPQGAIASPPLIPPAAGPAPSAPRAEKTSKWFLYLNRREQGPYTLSQLQALVSKGQLRPADYLRHEKALRWGYAGSVAELFPTASPPTPVTGSGLAPDVGREMPSPHTPASAGPSTPSRRQRLGGLGFLAALAAALQRSGCLQDPKKVTSSKRQ